MSTAPVPPVVELDRRDFAAGARRLLAASLGSPPAAGSVDDALVQVFAGMAEQVAERINRAPEKNFVTFLDLLGLELTPPTPARVPLTFSLAKGATEPARVPAGTAVSAAPPEGEKEPVLFETEADLVLTPATLAYVLVHDPARDAWADHSAAADHVGASFPAFGESDAALRPVSHRLHFDLSSALAARGERTLTLIPGDDASAAWMARTAWTYHAADGEVPLPLERGDSGWRAALADVPVTEVDGRRGRWLSARVTLPLRAAGEAARLAPAPSADGAVHPFGRGGGGVLHVAAAAFAVAGARVTLEVELVSSADAAPPTLVWEYAQGRDAWGALALDDGGDEDAAALRRSGAVAFVAPADWVETEVDGTTGHWLRVRPVDAGAGPAGFDPAVRAATAGYALPLPDLRLRVAVEMTGADALPAAATANGAPLDLSKDFLPLGPAPRFGDVFALALPGIGDKPGAEVQVDVVLSNAASDADPPPPAAPTDDLTLRWEFLVPATGRWETLGESGPGADTAAARFGFKDGTEAFASREPGPRRIRFTRPDTMEEGEVGGSNGCWLRARVVRGAYGHDAHWVREPQQVEYAVPVPPGGSSAGDSTSGDASSAGSTATEAPSADGASTATEAAAGWTTATRTMTVEVPRLVEATHRPPSLRSVAVGYAVRSGPHAPDAVLGDDGGTVTVWTGARPAAPDGGGPGPSLLLGFTRPGADGAFPGQPMTLFLAVDEPRDDGLLRPRPPAPAVEWEYWNGGAWAHLEVEDGTGALTRRGTVTFLGPADLSASDRLGRRAFWIRARHAGGAWTHPPRLAATLTNTVWAREGETVRAETLGSATGEPGQAFRTARHPVLPDAVLEVREPLRPSADDLARLEREGGRGAVRVVPATAGRREETWVRWTRVADFHGSDERARHYVLDALTGEVRFGDGLRGMVPPAGTGNVRLARYRVGGGTRGNRPAGAVSQLKAAVPYVAGVANPLPAQGGAEGEALPSLMARGPRQLRHRGRAVAPADFEDLARQASAGVARAFARTPTRAEDAGQVRVTVVADGAEDRPVPSAGLVAQVRDYLAARATPTLDVVVTGPRWLRVEVDAAVASVTPAAAFGLAPRVAERIRAFLHPLTGGADGRGWEPGRRPHKSELYAVIEDTEGVHHLDRLRIRVTREADGSVPERLAADDLLVFSGTHRVDVTHAGAHR